MAKLLRMAMATLQTVRSRDLLLCFSFRLGSKILQACTPRREVPEWCGERKKFGSNGLTAWHMERARHVDRLGSVPCNIAVQPVVLSCRPLMASDGVDEAVTGPHWLFQER